MTAGSGPTGDSEPATMPPKVDGNESDGGKVSEDGAGVRDKAQPGGSEASTAKASTAGLVRRGKGRGTGGAGTEGDEGKGLLEGEEDEAEEPGGDGGKEAYDGPLDDDPIPYLDGSEGSEQAGGTDKTSVLFAFGCLVLLFMAIITGVAVLVSRALFSEGRAEWMYMPPAVREHYTRGQFIKVQAAGVSKSPTVEIFVRSSGPPKGEVVVCVHGIGGSSFLFREIIPLLNQRGLRTIALDLPGAGLSDKPALGIYGTYNLAKTLGRVLASLGLPPVHLVLHDTAGLMGVTWAAQNVDKVRSLTLIDTPMERPFEPAVPFWLVAGPPILTALATKFTRPFRYLLQRFCARHVSEEAAEAHAYLLRCNGGLRATTRHYDMINQTRPFVLKLYEDAENGLASVERQLLWGSSWSPRWEGEGQAAAAHWPMAKLHSHTGGRWPQEDVPEEIAGLIASFVLALPPTVWSPPQEEVPEHIRRQFDAMKAQGGGHGHSHGHAHGPGCSHSH